MTKYKILIQAITPMPRKKEKHRITNTSTEMKWPSAGIKLKSYLQKKNKNN